MGLTEKDFFDDVLAIMTLPAGHVNVLIYGVKGSMEPRMFFKRLNTKHRILRRPCSEVNSYEVGEDITVTVSISKKRKMYENWDYQIILHPSRQVIFTLSDGRLSSKGYVLSKPLEELL